MRSAGLQRQPGRPRDLLLFVGGFVLVVAAFAAVEVIGQNLVAFEVSALSVNWIVLIASGALIAVLFRPEPSTTT